MNKTDLFKNYKQFTDGTSPNLKPRPRPRPRLILLTHSIGYWICMWKKTDEP